MTAHLIANDLQLETPDSIVDQLGSACNADPLDMLERVGYPVPNSGVVLNPNGTNVHDDAGRFTSGIDLAFPPAARMATAVICVLPEEDVLIETCEYSATGFAPFTNSVERYRPQRTVTIVNLRGAIPGASDTVVRGETPEVCLEVEYFNSAFGSKTKNGSSPTAADVAAALQGVFGAAE